MLKCHSTKQYKSFMVLAGKVVHRSIHSSPGYPAVWLADLRSAAQPTTPRTSTLCHHCIRRPTQVEGLYRVSLRRSVSTCFSLKACATNHFLISWPPADLPFKFCVPGVLRMWADVGCAAGAHDECSQWTTSSVSGCACHHDLPTTSAS